MDRLAIVYDADCGFCRACLAVILAWDRPRRLRPVALQDPAADILLAGMPEAERMASWHLVRPGGGIQSGGSAFEPLLRELRGGSALAALAERFPAAAERGYRWVAEHRSTFGLLTPARVRRWADARIDSSR